MSTPEEQTAAMIKNLPTTTGRSLAEWTPIVRASGLEKHGQIVAMLKTDYGLTHGYANLIALAVLGGGSLGTDGAALVDAQYAGKKAALRPILDRILETVQPFGADLTSRRRRRASACGGRSSSRLSSRRPRRVSTSASTSRARLQQVVSRRPAACARIGSA